MPRYWSLKGNAHTDPAVNFLGTTDGQPLVLRTQANEQARLGTNGDLGLGTVVPQVRLHVKGDRIRLESVDGTRTIDLRADGAALDLQAAGAPLFVNATQETTVLNPFGGSVGIGMTTAPQTQLHVLGRISSGLSNTESGAITLFPPDGSDPFHLDNGPAGGRLRISSGTNPGDNEIVNMIQDGRVGIGTSAPDARLTVHAYGPAFGGAPDDATVIGRMTNDGSGAGSQTAGLRGINDEGHGVQGQSISHIGVEGTSGTGTAIYAESQSGVGIWGVTDGGPYAGLFQGDVHVAGNLSKTGGGFTIDHPQDPGNKYLHHSFVESAERKNIYDGVAVLDEQGQAEVVLPGWFEALNRDLRYQLTALGSPAPNLHISREVSGGRFAIAGGAANQRICWQVTGVRDDQWARAHRLATEEDKSEDERGLYLHPQLHGSDKDHSILKSHTIGGPTV
jgi:hypothetical protein